MIQQANPSPPAKGVISLTNNCEVETFSSASDGKFVVILKVPAKRDFRLTLASEQEVCIAPDDSCLTDTSIV